MANTESEGQQDADNTVIAEAKDELAKVEDTDGTPQSKLEDQRNEKEGQLRREPTAKSKSVIKQGHLRVKEDGQMVYKKTSSQAIMAAIQLGIGYSVGRLGGKPERDILMTDFFFTEKVWFPSSGSKETPSHKFDDFRFKSYSPVAFRYFREIFGILPSDFLISLSSEPIREISNPGASGSLFFVSNDDYFIVKTVQHKEATFLQQLLQGYYMNLHQNPRTLLPKFFGLYCYQSGSTNIRLTVMNNLLPTKWKCHLKFDLKGSTYKRKANKEERAKKSPTLKDLDFLAMFPDGIILDGETYDAVIKTISRDVRFLESFKIMDYSFLLGIHNIDEARKDQNSQVDNKVIIKEPLKAEDSSQRKNIGAALEAIQVSKDYTDVVIPVGGIPARTAKGERFILFIGIIDILQSYRLAKKMEHGWKSVLTDGNTVSVHKPSYYAKRFLSFIKENVFTRVAVQRGASKKRSLKQHYYSIEKEPTDLPESSARLSRESQHEEVNAAIADKPRTKVVTIVEPTDTDEQSKADDNEHNKNEVDINDISIVYDKQNENSATYTVELVDQNTLTNNETYTLSETSTSQQLDGEKDSAKNETASTEDQTDNTNNESVDKNEENKETFKLNVLAESPIVQDSPL